MSGHLPVAALVVAVTFAATGLRKLADPLGARRDLAALGVAARATAAVTAGLTLGELAVAAGLLTDAGTTWTAAVALACLAVPAGAAAVQLARDQATAAAVSAVVRAHLIGVLAGVVWYLGRHGQHHPLRSWLAGLGPGQLLAVTAGAVLLALLASGVRRAPRTRASEAAVVHPPKTEHEWGAALVRPGPALTIGMATYDDFDGVYFTLQALRLYQDLDDTELLVVDNFGCRRTEEFVRDWAGGRYVKATDTVGTAAAKDLVFRHATGAAVLCCDSHVLFEPGVVRRLKQWHRDHPDSADLLQGPLVYDDGTHLSSHFAPVWREQMWGVWATDPRALDPDGEPFEILMQGLGAFSCRTAAWPGFHPGFRGLGGEEGYLHEKFRQAGHRCLCLPWLRWMHRFGRPRGAPYPLTIEDKLRNYVLGHAELGLDLAPVLAHFSQFLPADRVQKLASQALLD
ncbi:glycosyltransferase [Dactylosporangium sp. NPDC049742]|uniref:glycosyltransferase n=1 Tax=Dactylosporangium sp. NPDC049742 TaxID=3154737 RepID=UPI00342861AC